MRVDAQGAACGDDSAALAVHGVVAVVVGPRTHLVGQLWKRAENEERNVAMGRRQRQKERK